MIVWTHHPKAFQLTDPALEIEPQQGRMRSTAGYQQSLVTLQELLGETQFLWCCTTRGEFQRVTEEQDLVEWQLDVPDSHVVSLYREDVWHQILRGEGDWDDLLVPGTELTEERLGVFVRVPFPPDRAECFEMVPRHRN